jgi:hypothetical protein
MGWILLLLLIVFVLYIVVRQVYVHFLTSGDD